MKTLLKLLFIIGSLSASVSAQVMNVAYTDPDNNLLIDLFHQTPAPDGGYLLCGDVYSAFVGTNQNNRDILVVKTAANGSVEWSKAFGTTQKDDIAFRAVTVSDGYILGGYSASFNGLPAIMLMKIDLTGKLLWLKGYKVDNDEKIYDMILTSDGNLGFCGYYKHLVPKDNLNAYAFVAKANLNGEMLWFKPSCYASSLSARSIVEAPDGGLVTALNYFEGMWKVNSSGDHKWYATGGPQYKDRRVIKLEKRFEGGFALYCSYQGDDTKNHIMIQKYDTSGRLINAKLLHSKYDDQYLLDFHAVQKPDLGYQMVVWKYVNGISIPAFINTDSSGNVTSQYKLNNTNISFDLTAGTLKKSGTYLFPYSNFLNEVDFSGNSLNKTPLTDFIGLFDFKGVISSAILKTYGKCTATYTSLSTTLTERSITLSSKALGLIDEKTGITKGFLYPNPSSGNVSLHLPAGLDNADLIMTNILGSQVLSLKNIRSDQEISLEKLEDGVYLYKITKNDLVLVSEKIVINR